MQNNITTQHRRAFKLVAGWVHVRKAYLLTGIPSQGYPRTRPNLALSKGVQVLQVRDNWSELYMLTTKRSNTV